ncbi:SPOSA6832_01157, partial [Sporobolomyces salmonicolor]
LAFPAVEEQQEEGGGGGGVRASSRASRPRSPDGQSIRSVASSARSGDGGERERRTRVESLSAMSDRSVGRERESARGSIASGMSHVDLPKPLPISPQRKSTVTHGRASTTSTAASDTSSTRYPTLSSVASFRTADSRSYSTTTSTSTNRSSHKVDHAASTVSSSSVPIMPRRGSAVSNTIRVSSYAHDSMHAPALPGSPNPFSSDFDFPRPHDSAKIDELFEEMLPRLGTAAKAQEAARNLDTDKKWTLVYNDAFMKWKSAREKITRRSVDAKSAPAVGTSLATVGEYPTTPRAGERTPTTRGKNERPEWYIGKFMDGTITQQQVASLSVCLRTYELQWVDFILRAGACKTLISFRLRWLRSFIALKGQAVLGNALHNINKPDTHRKPDVGMEAELIKCLRTLFNHTDGARDAIENNTSISPITASLASEITTRKSVVELLTFFVARDRVKGFNLVLKGLDDFSSSRRLPGKFDGWFFFWEAAIDGRGRFGSSVGASEQVLSLRGAGAKQLSMGLANGRHAADIKDQALADYAVTNMLLIKELLKERDLKVRVHLRAAMELSGLRRILDKHAVLDHANLRRLIGDHYDDAHADEVELAEGLKEDVRMNFSDPRGCFEAVLANTDGRALDFFASMLKNLLLIPTEPEARMRHFQLIDRLVSSIVTDRRGLDGDFSQLLGSSVAQMVASYAAQDQLEEALEDLEDAKGTIARLKRDREALQEEVNQGDSGLVGQLKQSVEGLERALLTSRAATDSTKSELASKERDYLEQIAALRLDNRELYERLKAAGLLDGMAEDLKERMEKQIQRSKTVMILEGGQSPLEPLAPIPGQTMLGLTAARKRLESGIASSRLETEERLLSGRDQPASAWSPSPSPPSHRTPVRNPLVNGYAASPQSDMDATPQAIRLSPPIAASPSPSSLRPRQRQPTSHQRRPTLAEQIRDGAHKMGTSPVRDSIDNDGVRASSQHSQPLISTSTAPNSLVTCDVEPSLPETVVEAPEEDDDSESSKGAGVHARGHDDVQGSPSYRKSIDSVPSSFAAPFLDLLPPPDFDPLSHRPDTVFLVGPYATAPSTPILSQDSPELSRPLSLSLLPSALIEIPALSPSAATQAPTPQPGGFALPPPPPPPPPAPGTARFGAQKGGPDMPLSDLLAGRAKLRKTTGDTSPAPRSPAGPGGPPPPPPAPGAPRFANLNKTPLDVAQRKLKTFQWDKVSPHGLASTVWARNGPDGQDIAAKLRQQGIFDLMEEDFRAKQTAKFVTKRQKETLTTCLLPDQAKNIEIAVLKQAGSATDDTLTKVKAAVGRILRYSDDLDEAFLTELMAMLPSPEQWSIPHKGGSVDAPVHLSQEAQLNVHKSTPPEELDFLAPADRFLVELIKVYRLRPRLKAMIFREKFLEGVAHLEEQAQRVYEASKSLLNAPHFSELLKASPSKAIIGAKRR